jgi:hypothetical protein
MPPLPENLCSTLFTTVYKRLAEGGCQAFVGEAFCSLLKAFAFGFLTEKPFWCGRFLEGKRIAEGKRLLKGKELLTGNC